MNKLRITLDMIKFEHTVFALPFAFIGALLARKGLPTLWQSVWIVAAMVGGRSAAMTFNRMVDIRYDKMNPRTSGRALPEGTLSMQIRRHLHRRHVGAVRLLRLATEPACVFICRFQRWQSCFLYSYTKRFTSLSHLVLGFAIGCAPLAAWLAIRGEFAWPPVL